MTVGGMGFIPERLLMMMMMMMILTITIITCCSYTVSKSARQGKARKPDMNEQERSNKNMQTFGLHLVVLVITGIINIIILHY